VGHSTAGAPSGGSRPRTLLFHTSSPPPRVLTFVACESTVLHYYAWCGKIRLFSGSAGVPNCVMDINNSGTSARQNEHISIGRGKTHPNASHQAEYIVLVCQRLNIRVMAYQ
jgi:hypothetical protein